MEKRIVATLDVQLLAFKSKLHESRATNKLKNILPVSPNKRAKVIYNLIQDFEINLNDAPPSRKRERLSKELLKSVDDFYQRDDVSRWTPGIKEYVIVYT